MRLWELFSTTDKKNIVAKKPLGEMATTQPDLSEIESRIIVPVKPR